MNFEPGQEVVCIKQGPWITVTGPDIGNHNPAFNEIVTVRSRVVSDDGAWDFLTFEEYGANNGYGAKWFRPVLSREDLTRELENISEEEAIPVGHVGLGSFNQC